MGGSHIAGSKLKEVETFDNGGYWLSPNSGAKNDVGFSLRPCGIHTLDGNFVGVGSGALLWSSTSKDKDFKSSWYANFKTESFEMNQELVKDNAFGVRCIKD